MKPLSKASLDKLSDAHIARFESFLRMLPHPVINETECRIFLEIWRSIRSRDTFSQLVDVELQEVTDARFDGSYDDLLLPEERNIDG